MESVAVVERKSTALAEGEPVSGLVRLAIEKGVDVGVLERLVDLEERVAVRNARDAFNVALSSFQEDCPQVGRTARADFVNRKGTQTSYSYAPLDEIARAIRDPLKKHGLSYTWDVTVTPNGFLTATCRVRHIEGHSESASFTVPTTTNAAMSDQQKYGAAATYAQRRSLTQALGITTADEDNDGADVQDPDPVTVEQEATLSALLREVGADQAKFLEFFEVEAVSDLPAVRYTEAVGMLERKRRKA